MQRYMNKQALISLLTVKPAAGFLPAAGLLMVVLWCGCEVPPRAGRLVAIGEVNIPIEDDVAPTSIYLQYFKVDGGEYLVNIPKRQHRIDFYDLGSRSKTFDIDLKGIDELDGMINNIYFKNVDSIFCTAVYRNNLYMIDSSGTILQQWKNAKILDKGLTYKFYPNKFANILFLNDIILIPVLPSLSGESVSPTMRGYLEKKGISFAIAAFTLEQDSLNLVKKLAYVPDIFSKAYFGSCGIRHHYTKGLDSRSVVFSYGPESKVYAYDLEGNVIAKKAGSGHTKAPVEFDQSKYHDQNYRSQYTLESSCYRYILRDPYRKLYYRFVGHEVIQKEDERKVNHFLDKPFSIIVLDSSLNVLTEEVFASGQYHFSNAFVCKAGLLISNNHDLSPKYRKDAFSFTIFNYENQ